LVVSPLWYYAGLHGRWVRLTVGVAAYILFIPILVRIPIAYIQFGGAPMSVRDTFVVYYVIPSILWVPAFFVLNGLDGIEQTLGSDLPKAYYLRLAKTAKAPWTREALAAIEELSDQVILADVAKKAALEEARAAAIEKLVDQAVLAEIAKTDEDKDVRKTAEKRLQSLTSSSV
jgi:hypothetical protein